MCGGWLVDCGWFSVAVWVCLVVLSECGKALLIDGLPGVRVDLLWRVVGDSTVVMLRVIRVYPITHPCSGVL